LIILIVALGVFPKPVLDRITPSVNQLVIHVDQVTHTKVPASLFPAAAAAAAAPAPAAAAPSGTSSGHGTLSALAAPPGRDDPAQTGPTSAGGAP
jgi:NADH-quinone oxidoreductase subunit M